MFYTIFFFHEIYNYCKEKILSFREKKLKKEEKREKKKSRDVEYVSFFI